MSRLHGYTSRTASLDPMCPRNRGSPSRHPRKVLPVGRVELCVGKAHSLADVLIGFLHKLCDTQQSVDHMRRKEEHGQRELDQHTLCHVLGRWPFRRYGTERWAGDMREVTGRTCSPSLAGVSPCGF